MKLVRNDFSKYGICVLRCILKLVKVKLFFGWRGLVSSGLGGNHDKKAVNIEYFAAA